MKKLPFDLEKAKAGAKLVTRDGRLARIICWDLKTASYSPKIIYLILNEHEEWVSRCQDNGRISSEEEFPGDLFILEEPTFRAYANAEEFLRAMKEHGPMVRSISDGLYFPISRLDANEVIVRSAFCTFRKIKDLYAWQDGHPCGVEEGGEE